MKKCITICNLLFSLILFFFSAPAFASDLNSNIQSFEADSLIKSDGSYWVWGNNVSISYMVWGNGQAAPFQINGLSEVEKSFSNQLIMKKDHSIWFWDKQSPTGVIQTFNVESVNNLIDVQADWNSILALDKKNKVYLLSTQSKLDSSKLNQIVSLSGINNIVDISNYVEYEYSTRQPIKSRWAFLKKDGTVWVNKSAFPSEEYEQIASLDNVINIEQNFALKQDGSVWSWPNEIGNIAVKPFAAAPINQLKGIQVLKSNGKSNLAVDKNFSLWYWGITITGVTDGTTYHYQPVPVKLTTIKDVKDAFVAERSLVVLTNKGDVYVTTIDRESMPENPVFEHILSDVQQIKAGSRHIILQKKDGSLWGWGVNKNGQLGCGDFAFMHNTPQRMQKPVSVYLNSESVVLNNAVIVRNGQSFIPLRSVFEKMGAALKWDVYTKTVTISRNEAGKQPINISINYNSKEVYMDKKRITLSNSPFIFETSAYLPLRFISESLGAKVEWIQNEDKILISFPLKILMAR